MKKTLFPLFVSLLCAPLLFAGELPGAAAAASTPAAQAGEKPGEKIPSEDSTLKNFHQVGIGLYGGKLFRGAAPVRELAKSSSAPLDDPKIMEAAGRIMAHVKTLGINTIISLEAPTDTEKDGKRSFSFALEKAAARPAGITLLSHPMNNADLKDMTPDAILSWLKGVEKDINASVKKGGVLFHCAAGHDRTGLVAAYLRITISKWPVERAIAEMRDLGHNWPRYSSNGGKSSWHEEFLKNRFGAAAVLNSFDGYGLEYRIDYPADKEVTRVVVLLHGSGGHDMDEDLSVVSSSGTKNLFFVDVSSALTNRGFAVVRYNKRSFQWKRTARLDPAFMNSKGFKKFTANPLKYFVEDAAAFARFAHKTFPKAKIYLLGHSEGTQVALQVAAANPWIEGAALIGFTAQPLDISMFEQTVYRSLHYFDELDLDRNGSLGPEELKQDAPECKSISAQFPLLDLNKNGTLERSEFMGGNLSNILLDAPSLPEYRRQEAAYKKPAAIIKDARFDIAFFQGELDNQAPAYNAKAVQIMNAAAWKKPNLHFRFFEGLGHALDKRAGYYDIVYRAADPQALAEMAAELDSYWQ